MVAKMKGPGPDHSANLTGPPALCSRQRTRCSLKTGYRRRFDPERFMIVGLDGSHAQILTSSQAGTGAQSLSAPYHVWGTARFQVTWPIAVSPGPGAGPFRLWAR